MLRIELVCMGLLGMACSGCASNAPLASVERADADASRPGNYDVYDFRTNQDSAGWQVEDDVVMGGRSRGAFAVNADGHGVFSPNIAQKVVATTT